MPPAAEGGSGEPGHVPEVRIPFVAPACLRVRRLGPWGNRWDWFPGVGGRGADFNAANFSPNSIPGDCY